VYEVSAFCRYICSCVVVLICITACEKPNPELIRFGLSNSIVSLDPRFATDATSSRICRLIYEPLVKFDESFRAIGALATWRQDSPTRYLFTLEQSHQFHDGSAVTAEDVVATYQSILDPRTASPHRGSLELISAVYATDNRTVVFELQRADPLFPGFLTIGIMRKSAVAKTADEKYGAMIGSGPFAMVGGWTDKHVLLKRVVDQVAVRFETVRDPTVRALKIVNKEIDILQGGLAPEIVAWLDGQENISTLEHPGTTYTYMGLNLQDPYLSKHRIRKALSMALNREEIAKRLFVGRARLAKSIFTPEHWAYNPTLDEISYDPDQARAILAEFGFGPSNPLQLSYKTSSDLLRLRVATVIQDQFAKVGVELDIQSYDWGTFYGDIKAGRFQVFSLSWVGLKLPDIFRYVFHSESIPPIGANRGRYEALDIDSMIEKAEYANELSEKIVHYRDIQAKLLEDLPYIPLWYEDHVVVLNDSIEGYSVGLDGNYDALENTRRKTLDGERPNE
jgi:peptide/nickel transport system substrate-binding protein